jgi:hypothetical protein
MKKMEENETQKLFVVNSGKGAGKVRQGDIANLVAVLVVPVSVVVDKRLTHVKFL